MVFRKENGVIGKLRGPPVRILAVSPKRLATRPSSNLRSGDHS